MYARRDLRHLHFLRFLLISIVMPIAAGTAAAEIPGASGDVLQHAAELTKHSRYEEAAALLENARARAGAESSEYFQAALLNKLGLIYAAEGNFLAARSAFDRSISIIGRLKGERDPALLEPLNNLAELFYEAGQNAQAENLIRRNLSIRKAIGKTDANTGAEMNILGKVYLNEHKYALAKQSAENSLMIFAREGCAESLSAAVAWSILGAVYSQNGESAPAQESLEHTLALLQKVLDPSDFRIAEGMANLGLFYGNHGALEAGETLLEKAHEVFRENGLNTVFSREILVNWAEMERKSGHKHKARDLEREARALMDRSSAASLSRYVVDASAFR